MRKSIEMGMTIVRIILTLLAAAAGVGLFLYSDHSLKNYFSSNLKTQNTLQQLQTDFYALESEILSNSSFLYYNYDSAHHLIAQMRKQIQNLERSDYLLNHIHLGSRKKLQAFSEHFERYSQDIEHYLTLNASLKNSVIYIPTLQLKAHKLFDTGKPIERKALLLLSQINATIFLANNAKDTDFLPDIRTYLDRLQRFDNDFEGPRRHLLQILEEHLKNYVKTFPQYVRLLRRLLHNQLQKDLSTLNEEFQRESARELIEINRTNQLLLLLYLFSLFIVLIFIFWIDRENRRLKRMKRELETSLITDSLTGLGNRLAYQQQKHKMRHPVLILANIERFKHINEFYGTRIGDKVLKSVARKLIESTPSSLQANHYRLGGDDFGILFEKENLSQALETLLQEFHDALENLQVVIEDLQIDLNFVLGASERKSWLFETADMALKFAKNSQRRRYVLYRDSMDNREEIANNIQILRSVRNALERDTLLPYFQPIYNRKERRIDKFEALARIEQRSGKEIMQPSQFIPVAKEAKLSGEITVRILEKTLENAEKYPYFFSVNLEADDIDNFEDRERILSLLDRNPALGKRIIFELLETEKIRDYEIVSDFIDSVKRRGCRIAIDDFGSGYSNFEKLLELDIDILKVDGSLIRRIDYDSHSELIVKTILDFARLARWRTVAEFVHSRSVYEKVSSLGFDDLQGYYLGAPIKEIPTKPQLPFN